MQKKLIINILSLIVLGLIFGNTASASKRGATVPFRTFEAEDNLIGGAASKNLDKVILEVSSEKAYVHLQGTGGFVRFACDAPANRLTLRYSIPKNSNGTISLYLNGTHKMDIPLTSAQCYDSQSTNTRLRRYDEKSLELELKKGDIVKFQKDEGDTCSWYGIDLIDLELAPDPLPMPENYLSITDFGATPNDTIDDTEAIKRCIAAAAEQGKGVWIPPGSFYQNTRISIPANINMMGAGIWYSNLHNSVIGRSFSDDYGYALVSGSTISDIKFTGISIARKLSTHLFRPIGKHETLKNLWIQNIGCIYGWSPGGDETCF
ncbi:MAG: glycosyl hydrolase family 28-related protein, partial [Draconibacterium sp.]